MVNNFPSHYSEYASRIEIVINPPKGTKQQRPQKDHSKKFADNMKGLFENMLTTFAADYQITDIIMDIDYIEVEELGLVRTTYIYDTTAEI